MTYNQFVAMCLRANAVGIGITLHSPSGKQPLKGFRGELLCCPLQGGATYRYNLKQVKRMIKLIRITEELDNDERRGDGTTAGV